jgi:8-oxo-dGTP diphosphatase
MTDNKSHIPKVAVRAIIKNAIGKILVLKRANTSYGNGSWNLPGGKIDYLQTAVDAVNREIEEETSLKSGRARFLFYMDNLPSESSDLHFVTLFFECICTGEVNINDESNQYQWIDRIDIESLDLAFGHDIALLKYYHEF